MAPRLVLLTFVFHCALRLSSAAGLVTPEVAPEPRLIGWQGETYHPDDENTKQNSEPGGGSQGQKRRPTEQGGVDSAGEKPWVQVLSWAPRAFIYHGFLSKLEIRHILKLAGPQMKRSMVEGPNHTGVVDSVRTSAGMFLRRHHDSVITAVEQRMSAWTHLPISYQEDIQVLRYGVSNKYGAHMDGLGRVMSVLIYLIAPEEGGETAFPETKGWLHSEMGEPKQGNFSACAKGHVAYKPKPGDALMFYDRLPDYINEDVMSTHTGCPVVKGVKWNAVMWIHGEPFQPENYEKQSNPQQVYEENRDPGVCTNHHEQCDVWAAAGECDNNPMYMVGKPDGVGSCRLACKDCEVCSDGDTECVAQNRESGGYINFDKAEFLSVQ
ncbi:hypothetical protein FOA52_004245 [Chlamydomonas sp. UWO 241]|nr:hypothetical protein FOA52_004245 [Chlamydomonas sp. UWO 241]